MEAKNPMTTTNEAVGAGDNLGPYPTRESRDDAAREGVERLLLDAADESIRDAVTRHAIDVERAEDEGRAT